MVLDIPDGPEHTNGHGNLAAAALPMRVGVDRILPQRNTWQEEVWGFYDTLGEFRYGVTWLSEMVARCRLTAARRLPGGDEPGILLPDTKGLKKEEKAAIELVQELGGGIGGQSDMLETLAAFLAVPGEGWILGEENAGGNAWRVLSADEVRRGSRGNVEIIDDTSTPDKIKWRRAANGSLMVRVWRPHKRLRYLADSPANAAREIMRELVLINRKIQAQYLSRLASAGLVVFPTEVTFPVPEHLQDAPDPFVAAWIEAASTAIQTPGTAAATVPIPIRVPGEYVDKIKHIDFTLKIDDKEIEKRESAIKRLATALDLPAEILLGMGDLNHWSAWQIEESGIKVHVAPVIEIICSSLTTGYLQPRLMAEGIDAKDLIIWYDTSELTVRPDHSENAMNLYDRLEIHGDALRRETGFAEDDKPDEEQFKEMALRFATRQPALTQWALDELGIVKAPEPLPGEAPAAPAAPGQRPPVKQTGQAPAKDAKTTEKKAAPKTKDTPPSSPAKETPKK